MKHTPGPWICEESEDGHLIKMGVAALNIWERQEKGIIGIPSHLEISYDHMCFVEGEVEGTPGHNQALEAEANALLIAAAPDLLEACKAALERLNQLNKGLIPGEVRLQLINVINKAEGGLPNEPPTT